MDAVPGAVAFSLPDQLLDLRGQIPPGTIGEDLPPLQKPQQILLAFIEGRALESLDTAFGDAHPPVGDDQVGIDVDDPPESVAGLACADGIVERKNGR